MTPHPHSAPVNGATPAKATNSAISGGAIGGIVAGAIGGMVVALLFAFWLYRRRRRNVDHNGTISQELAVEEKRDKPAVEAQGTDMAELPDKPVLFEAKGGEKFEMPVPVAELEDPHDLAPEKKS
jgi:hypothetical protein